MPHPSQKPQVMKSDDEWRKQLTSEQYHVTREGGTERPFSGKYYDTRAPGIYRCVCCNTALFDAKNKYDSGTGWPSFWAPIEDDRVLTTEDHSLGMRRTEVVCRQCHAHLGHVFTDGPQPTGLRYCMNSASLSHEPE